MKKRFGCIKVAAGIVAVALTACAPSQSTPAGTPNSAKADEAAIRQLLANTEQRINQDDLGFVDAFANDAVIMAPSAPNIVGFDAIRTMYASVLKNASMQIRFSTEELVVTGDLAYERGTYTLRMSERASGRVLVNATNRHIHFLKRQSDGSWKTWRMMTNSAAPTSTQN